MLKYAKEKGALEELYKVIEYHFSNLFCRNTLLYYIQVILRKI